MCAIVDANARDQVFGDAQSEAGKFFLDWLLKPKGGTLVLGGKLRSELSDGGRNRNFMRVYGQLRLDGRVKDIPDGDVETETAALEAVRICRSDDAHVLALARLSGARLLYTNDQDLQDDFNNPQIVNDPRGRVYTTLPIGGRRYAAQRDTGTVTGVHRELLERTDHCSRVPIRP